MISNAAYAGILDLASCHVQDRGTGEADADALDYAWDMLQPIAKADVTRHEFDEAFRALVKGPPTIGEQSCHKKSTES